MGQEAQAGRPLVLALVRWLAPPAASRPPHSAQEEHGGVARQPGLGGTAQTLGQQRARLRPGERVRATGSLRPGGGVQTAGRPQARGQSAQP